MIIAMIAMWMVQLTIVQVVEVVAMRHSLVVAVLMPTVAGYRLALFGVGGVDGNLMLIVVSGMFVMQMTIV